MLVELAWSVAGIIYGPVMTTPITKAAHRGEPECGLAHPNKIIISRETFTVSLVLVAGIFVLDHQLASAPLLAASSWLAVTGTQLMMTDWIHHRLPNPLVTAMLVGGLVIFSYAAAEEGRVIALLRAITAAAVVFIGGLTVAVTAPGALGAGDIKLLGTVALYLGWVGWSHVLRGVVLALFLGSVVGAVLLATRRISRDDRFAFGPAVVGGALLTLVTP
ncbi:prepilin peptidase [Saccharothrix lopnurensis]|uniref:Prepilin peptidase n=1 Tax=Saccharothrix lopnurensis TaxID=1670621 RepID=A0ABW1P944_9PSEU